MLKKAVLISFDPGTYTATVRPCGSLSAHLTSIPVSRAIPPAEMTPGRYCAMAVFDEPNPLDSVIIAVFTA